MSLDRTRNIIIIAGVAAVCAVAAIAVVHSSHNGPAGNAVVGAPPPPAYTSSFQAAPAQPESAAAPVYATDGYYPTIQRPIYVRAQPQYAQPAPQPAYAVTPEYRAPVGRSRPVYRERRRGRSKKHSVEIVAGTAAAGAAIGAIAGGGKGAAIGGLSGAGAGFAYDRLTHNH